jgi:hypothetical protein
MHLGQGVAFDARLERGRSPRDALQRLWAAEPFDRILIPVSGDDRAGFSEQDVASSSCTSAEFYNGMWPRTTRQCANGTRGTGTGQV